MSYRLEVRGGEVRVVEGEARPDLLAACRELAAEEPDGVGTVVLRGPPDQAPGVEFHGRFSEAFRQRVRNLWGLTTGPGRIPARLDAPRPVFRVTVGRGVARSSLGEPPAEVSRFCAAFARAHPGAEVQVTALADPGGLRLQVVGEMPPHLEERLRRRWAECAEAAAPDAAAPGRGRRWQPALGALLGAVALHVLLAVWAERQGIVVFNPRMGPEEVAGGQGRSAGEAAPAPRPVAPAEPGEASPRPAAPEALPGIIERLREARRASPEDPRLKERLAEAHHAYGAALARRGEWEPAVANVETAVRLAPGEPRLRQSLARVLLAGALDLRQRLHDGAVDGHGVGQVREWVERAVREDPRHAEAQRVLGDLEYEGQQLAAARAAWLRARELDPGLAGLQERLSRLGREYAAEAGMRQAPGYDFILRYQEGLEGAVSSSGVVGLLDEARQLVGRAFDHWPERRIVVLLYTPEAYRWVRAEAPDWSAGLYDGKIRIPVPRGRADADAVRRIITHEYTHAVVHDLAGGRCPRWLNEGLAELQAAGQATRDATEELRRRVAAGGPIPWLGLDASFQTTSAGRARLCYDQAHSMVAYLAQTHGFWSLRRVLAALAGGADPGGAFAGELGVSLDEAERGWRQWIGGRG